MVVAGSQSCKTCATETTHQRPVVKTQWQNRNSSRSRHYWLRGLWLTRSVSERGKKRKGRVTGTLEGSGHGAVVRLVPSISGSPTPWLARLVLARQAPVFSAQALDWPRTEPPPNHQCKALSSANKKQLLCYFRLYLPPFICKVQPPFFSSLPSINTLNSRPSLRNSASEPARSALLRHRQGHIIRSSGYQLPTVSNDGRFSHPKSTILIQPPPWPYNQLRSSR